MRDARTTPWHTTRRRWIPTLALVAAGLVGAATGVLSGCSGSARGCGERTTRCNDDGTGLLECRGPLLVDGAQCPHGCTDDGEIAECAACDGELLLGESVCTANGRDRVSCTESGLVTEACAACCFTEGGDGAFASCGATPADC